jgi:hypothetical protein
MVLVKRNGFSLVEMLVVMAIRHVLFDGCLLDSTMALIVPAGQHFVQAVFRALMRDSV